jgi:hypothetical protein
VLLTNVEEIDEILAARAERKELVEEFKMFCVAELLSTEKLRKILAIAKAED